MWKVVYPAFIFVLTIAGVVVAVSEHATLWVWVFTVGAWFTFAEVLRVYDNAWYQRKREIAAAMQRHPAGKALGR